MSLKRHLYFYHIVNKNADISKGLYSLKYFYDNKMFDLFDKYAFKYKKRIVNDWNMEKYYGMDPSELNREDILDALTLFRGKYGASYIYFFRYPLYKELGFKISELLKVKDIYRIDINDKKVQELIIDIFYGYDMSDSDNKLLSKKYYETVSEKEYFSKYNDNDELNFAKLNHIAIVFKDDYVPIEFLEKV